MLLPCQPLFPAPIETVGFVSWGIAFVEHCFQVPANRIGHAQFTTAQLKTIQEVITIAVLPLFSAVDSTSPEVERWGSS